MRLSPSTVRIVLSGHADQDMVRKTIGLAHQYLSKPCDAALLRSTISRACRLRGLLRDERLRDLAGRMQTMPSLPTLYLRLVELMRDPAASLRQAGELVACDLGMSMKVLQLVNSAFFGLPRQLSDPVEAVSLLGMEMIQSLALTTHAFSELDAGVGRIASADELWAQCMLVAKVARRIALAENATRAVADAAFMGGMLHQVGRLLLAANYGDDYSRIRRAVGASASEADTAEAAQFGATHAELGAYLLGLWGIPDAIVEAVAFHRRPSACEVPGFSPLAAVHAAHCLVDAGARTPGRLPLDAVFLTRIGCLERLGVWREAYLAVIAEAGAP
jgi:HD-like signal output (HDOD) protein